MVLVGDFNMTMSDLQLQMGPWALPFRVLPTNGDVSTRRTRAGSPQTPAIDFITFCGETATATSPSEVLDSWDISDHFPVIAALPGLTRIPSQGALPPPPTTLGRRIIMEDVETRYEVQCSNYWQPLAASLEEDVEASRAEIFPLADLPPSHQARLDRMAKQFTDTCHLVADDLDLHQKPGGSAPPRVAARVRKAIDRRREVFRDLRRAEARNNEDDIARLGEEYQRAQLKARRVIRTTGRRSWYKTIREAHVNMRARPRCYWRWASATAGWRPKSSAAGIQPVLGPDGTLLTALTDIHRAWGDHYASLAADPTGHSQDASHWDFLDPHPQGNEWIHSLDDPFSDRDVWKALKKMKNHRAPGGDGVPTELLKACLVERDNRLRWEGAPPQRIMLPHHHHL